MKDTKGVLLFEMMTEPCLNNKRIVLNCMNPSNSNQGSGSANTGAVIININAISLTGTVQTDLIDQPIS
jgi:hypothetical protein